LALVPDSPFESWIPSMSIYIRIPRAPFGITPHDGYCRRPLSIPSSPFFSKFPPSQIQPSVSQSVMSFPLVFFFGPPPLHSLTGIASYDDVFRLEIAQRLAVTSSDILPCACMTAFLFLFNLLLNKLVGFLLIVFLTSFKHSLSNGTPSPRWLVLFLPPARLR